MFVHGHATHPDWRVALSIAAAQLEAQLAERAAPTLGFVYLTDAYARSADAVLDTLREHWPGAAWAGAVGVGVCASGVEYFDEPALALMLTDLAPRQFRVFSGARPLSAGFAAHTALVHADPATPDLGELIGEMSERVASGYLFGGLAMSRRDATPLLIADGAYRGGLAGVAFDAGVSIVSRVTQGCQPIGPTRVITSVDGNIVRRLDNQPALAVMLQDLGLAGTDLKLALPRLQRTLVGLSDQALRRSPRDFGEDVQVRHLIGLDPAAGAIAIADRPEAGQSLAFCTRDTEAARRDLTRICTEIRDELESDSGAHEFGAVYVSCNGRGGPHFGAPSAELQIVKRALGDIPLVGFFAAGEIGHDHMYGYTGVLTVLEAGSRAAPR